MKKRGCCNKCKLLKDGQCKDGNEPKQGFNSSVYQCSHRKLYAKEKKKQDNKRKKILVDLLDVVFGDYIRYRDMGICITCPTHPDGANQYDPAHRQNFHPGHYISREKRNTRWDEENVFGQCAGCNLTQHFEGNGLMLEKILEQRRLTMDKVIALRIKSRIIRNFSIGELEDLLEVYKVKLDKVKERYNNER